jgi:hypothetical protein
LPAKLSSNFSKLLLPETVLSISEFFLTYPNTQGWVDFVPMAVGFKVFFNTQGTAAIIGLQLPVLQINPASLALYKQRTQYNEGWTGFIEEFATNVCHYDTKLASWLASLIVTSSHKAKPIVNACLNPVGICLLEKGSLCNEFMETFL